MNNKQLVESIAEFAASKNIDRPTVIHMLRDVLQALISKKFGPGNNFDVIIDPKKGDLQIWRTRIIVPDPDPSKKETTIEPNEIYLSDARKIEVDFSIGEEVVEEINLLEVLGRRAVTDGLHLLINKKDILEKEQLYEYYNRLIGKIIDAEVGFSKPNFTILYDDDKNDIFLPRENQIPKERFRKGNKIKVLIDTIEQKRSKLHIIGSRTSPLFVEQLLTKAIPEIADKTVVIKNLARIPGFKSKVIVESQDDRIPAAGACIGPNGRRIQAIRKEHLNNEGVEIITYTNKFDQLIKRIVGIKDPIKVVENDEQIVINIKAEQMPIVTQNKPFLEKLFKKKVIITINTSQKTGEESQKPYEDDVYLDNFSNEIETEMINMIKGTGLITAKEVLLTSKDTLLEQTSLSQDDINNIYSILQKEFEHTTPNTPSKQDILLDNLIGKIDPEIINAIKAAGLTTVREVINTSQEELSATTKLDLEIIKAVHEILANML